MNTVTNNETYQNIELEKCMEEIRYGEIILLGMNLIDRDVPIIIKNALNSENHCLQLNENNLTFNGIKMLTDALKANTVLDELLLSNNSNIGDNGIEYLVDLLMNYNRTLKVLDVSKINLTDCGLVLLANGLKANINLTEIRLGGNNFTNGGIKILADALKTNSTISDLDLSENNLTSECVKILAGALKYNTTLKILDLSRNENIQDDGIEYLSQVLLDDNRTLSSLKLDMTGITDHGFKVLCNVVRTYSTLKCLFVNCNRLITDACIDFLILTLQETSTLRLLGMHYCYLSKHGRKLLHNQAQHSQVRLELNQE
ncbi:unnamed protein product [Rotaria magnacalcarata]|uniref:Uncharacterized protein n=2 Tax=Rotaria magnacalcarata TaxID=392030 RepID=A0A815KPQ7_9BILA|nr:unnamed protein product [Rotaria magnacalcarata]CAF1634517.1 unnamed protein product [Rotaria magnacalcarata]CAF4066329.1 unnamed protein product [Rotaria magnacalcarata]